MIKDLGFTVFGDLKHENPLHTLEEIDLKDDEITDYIKRELSTRSVIVYCESALMQRLEE